MLIRDFKAGVGSSEKWDAREAGREVAENTLEKLDGKKPNFFLLFSTIHYEKYGGFKEFLNGVWEVLPEGTPLIGGTVAGFITPEDCFVHGAAGLAVSYPNMDVAVGVGYNTKRNPTKAGKECGKQLTKRLQTSPYPNGIVYHLISASTIYNIPGMKRVLRFNNSLINRVFSLVAAYVADFSVFLFQRGLGNEDKIYESLLSELPKDYTVIGGDCIDDNKMCNNYQFIGKTVINNGIVALGIKTDLNVHINTTYGLKETGKKINVTHFRSNNRIIHKINNKPAVPELVKVLDWGIWFFDDETILRRTFFLPFGFEKNGILHPQVIGMVIGDDIGCGYRITKSELSLLSASGRSMLESIDENLNEFKDKNNQMALIFSCAARLESLGFYVYYTKEKLQHFFKNIPFLLVYVGGEDTRSSEKGCRHVYESFNVSTLYK